MSALAGVLLRDLQPEPPLHHVRDAREALAGPPRPGCSVRRQRLFQNGHAVEVRAGHARGERDVLVHQLHGERGVEVALDHAHHAAIEVRRVGHAAALADDVVVGLRIDAEPLGERQGLRHGHRVHGAERVVKELDAVAGARGAHVHGQTADDVEERLHGGELVPIAADHEEDLAALRLRRGAEHRGVEMGDPAPARRRVDLLRGLRRHRRAVAGHEPWARARQHAGAAQVGVEHDLVVGQRAEEHARVRRDVAGCAEHGDAGDGAGALGGVVVMAMLALVPARAQTGKAEIQWLGQAATKITTPGGKVIVIDPWLTTNPKTPAQYKNLDALGKVDLILVTHAHGDHLGDAPELAKKHNVPMWAPAGLQNSLVTLGILPTNLAPRMNKGGVITPLGPDIKITMTRAEHSSEMVWKNPATGKDETHVGGEAVGFIVQLENGFKVYHMGDTGLFGDMRLIGEYYKPDLLLIPIGGHFVMSPQDAAVATRDFIKPKVAIPIHYGTIPQLKGTPEEYIQALGPTSVKVHVMQPGDKLMF